MNRLILLSIIFLSQNTTAQLSLDQFWNICRYQRGVKIYEPEIDSCYVQYIGVRGKNYVMSMSNDVLIDMNDVDKYYFENDSLRKKINVYEEVETVTIFNYDFEGLEEAIVTGPQVKNRPIKFRHNFNQYRPLENFVNRNDIRINKKLRKIDVDRKRRREIVKNLKVKVGERKLILQFVIADDSITIKNPKTHSNDWYVCDKRNNTIREKVKNSANGYDAVWKYSYIFDERGEWIRMIVDLGNNTYAISNREIFYRVK